jgi:hypothetical protein
LSDQFGVHSQLEVPVEAPTILRITKAYWFDDPAKPSMIELPNQKSGGHLLVRIEPLAKGDGSPSYAEAYASIGKDFVLQSAGQPDVHAAAERGYWLNSDLGVYDFYVRIPPAEFERMKRGVRYALVPVDTESTTRWTVAPSVTLTRP